MKIEVREVKPETPPLEYVIILRSDEAWRLRYVAGFAQTIPDAISRATTGLPTYPPSELTAFLSELYRLLVVVPR